mmetsp:Transcript_31169/g.74091  ORF Transcript_31169/g.74091 Transcript_31169/m.74091 type:complete len:627 (+) Transcript_31169:171-2051(+)
MSELLVVLKPATAQLQMSLFILNNLLCLQQRLKGPNRDEATLKVHRDCLTAQIAPRKALLRLLQDGGVRRVVALRIVRSGSLLRRAVVLRSSLGRREPRETDLRPVRDPHLPDAESGADLRIANEPHGPAAAAAAEKEDAAHSGAARRLRRSAHRSPLGSALGNPLQGLGGEPARDPDRDSCRGAHGDRGPVRGHEHADPEGLPDLPGEELHPRPLPVDEHHVPGGALLHEPHDALRVRVGAEGEVPDLAGDAQLCPLVDVDGLPVAARQEFVPDRPGDAVAREDDHVELGRRPALEDLEGGPPVQHAGGREEDAGPGAVDEGAVPLLHAAKAKRVALRVARLDLLARPADEQLIVEVGLGSHPRGEVDWHVEVHPLPVLVEEDAELLSAPEREHRYEHLPAVRNRLVDLREEVPLAGALGVADARPVGRLGHEEVRPQPVDVGRPEVPVGRHVVVPCVDDALRSDAEVKHGRAEDVPGVVGADLHVLADAHGLVQVDAAHLLHAVRYVSIGEQLDLATPVNQNLSEVFKHYRYNCSRWVCHKDGTIITTDLREVRESSAVVKVKVRYNHCIHGLRVVTIAGNHTEVRESSLILIAHMHSAVEHDCFASNIYDNAAPPNLLTSTQC